MNRDEFIMKQLNKFGCFNDNNMAIWKNDYEIVLQEPNIDFEQLDLRIIREWDDTFKAPSTKWLKDAKIDCIPKDERCEALKHIQSINEGESCPPPADIKARIEAMKKKMRAV